MQSSKYSRRAALAVLALLITVGVIGCGREGNDWQEATSASGNYVAEFPGQPTTETMQLPNRDLSMQLTKVDTGDSAFVLSEGDLTGFTPKPLDGVVDATIEGMRAEEDAAALGSVTVTEISRTTGDFEGVETRSVSFTIDRLVGKKTVAALIFHRNDTLVSAIVVYEGEADPEAAQRFLSSLKSNPAPDSSA
jgi:hypothetical protein